MTRRKRLGVIAVLLAVLMLVPVLPATGRVQATAVTTVPAVYDIDFGTPASGWAVGIGQVDAVGHVGGKALATTDGGLTWRFQTIPAGTSVLWAVAAASAANAVAVGDGGSIA